MKRRSIVWTLALLTAAVVGIWARQQMAIESRDQPATADDLRILRRADALLGDASVWNRHDDRVCDDDEASGKRSLFCALQKADREILGEYQHRNVALQEVRFVIGDRARLTRSVRRASGLSKRRSGDESAYLGATGRAAVVLIQPFSLWI